MKKLYLSMVIIILSAAMVWGQGVQFKVLVTSGTVQFKQGPVKRTLKTGDKLFDDAQIELAPGSYVGLIHNSGTTLELTAPGVYRVSELAHDITAPKSNISRKFTDYLLAEVIRSQTTPGDDYLKDIGAVERQMMDNVVNVIMPDSSNVMRTKITFKWHKVTGVDRYYFEITDVMGEKKLRTVVYDTMFIVNLKKLDLKENCFYNWSVYLAEDSMKEHKEYSLYLLSEKKASAITDTLQILLSTLGKQGNAVTRLVIAYFYEKNNLMIDAMAAYREAMLLAPQIKTYRKVYVNFLSRVGLKSEARQLLKG